METKSLSSTQYSKMVETPISKLITSLAVPTVISMLITALYNIADTFFVSQINTESSAAVGIVFPVMAIIQAFGFTLGMGCGSIISRRLGEKRNEEASAVASTAFFASLATGLLVTLFGNIFSSQIMSSIGASENVLPYANDYAKYIFYGAPFMIASFVLNNVLRAEGKAVFSMVALSFGGILNIILDPIFIFVFDLGITGAALATFVSQIISFLILLSWFICKKVICVISFTKLSWKISIITSIVLTGFPSLFRQGLASLATILLNRACINYGDHAVAAMAITTKIVMFVASIMIGIGQGFTPVAGYNYGAKKYDRVKKAYWFTVGSGMAILGIFSICGLIFAKEIVSSFINDMDVIKIGTVALRWQIAILPLHPIIVTTNMLLQATGYISQSTFLSCNRQGVYFIPLILILPHFMGLFGIEIAQACADFLSVITAIPYLIWFLKKIEKIDA
ncbi:MAG: MATE family efflux transporter [Spirochaetaceae bacterium]|nr:MATE family efflux transporter [Spirochaetaceae bacterium]